MKKIEQKPNDLFDGYPDEFKNFMTVRLTRFSLNLIISVLRKYEFHGGTRGNPLFINSIKWGASF